MSARLEARAERLTFRLWRRLQRRRDHREGPPRVPFPHAVATGEYARERLAAMRRRAEG